MARLVEIEGIGEAYAAKLADLGITKVQDLLDKGAIPQGRAEIAERTGISPRLVLRWVNRADLSRVKGVGSE